MPPKINKLKPKEENNALAAAKAAALENASQLINFSFKYLDLAHDKFSCIHNDLTYYTGIIARMKDLSSMKKLEFTSNRSSALRMHPIEWSKTTEKEGFRIPQESQLVDTPYQFSLSSNEHGRIHGFFILNTFYIVWLDKNHMLYKK